MSTPTTPDAPQDAPQAESAPVDTPTPDMPAADGDGTQDETKPAREAAKYRRQLRDVEAERDGLRATVDALRRAEVARHAEAAKVKPEAIWAAGHDVAGLLAEDGTVDATKVAEAIKATRAAFGITPPLIAPRGDFAGNVGEPIPWQDEPQKFAAAFAPPRRP